MNIFFKILLLIFLILKTSNSFSEENKIKIGILAPLSGENAELGQQIVNSIRMALIEISDNKIEVYPKDTKSDPNITLRSAKNLEQLGVSLVIGPVFHKNLLYLNEVDLLITDWSGFSMEFFLNRIICLRVRICKYQEPSCSQEIPFLILLSIWGTVSILTPHK